MTGSIPVEFIFNPNWWFRNYSIPFDEPFYLDKATRIENELRMRQALHDRFGLGKGGTKVRPVIGSPYVAGGFVIPALLGLKISFSEGEAPCPVRGDLGPEDVRELRVPDIRTTWPMNLIIADIERLMAEHGYVEGDLNTDGILNTAVHLRGNALFTDFYDDPSLVCHLFQVIAETMIGVARLVRSATGTCSVAVNRSILHLDPSMFLHANCSLQMISPALYSQFLLPWELYMARELQPYGIHHCGSNLHKFAAPYSQIPARFFDVGWGSDVALCRKAFPEAFLNLRLSPVRLFQMSAEEVREDAYGLLDKAGSRKNVGLCCINMDYGTRDENVRAVIELARKGGAKRLGRGSEPAVGRPDLGLSKDVCPPNAADIEVPFFKAGGSD